VGLSAPAEFITGPPVTTSGTLTLAKATEPANQVWAGPASGAASLPSFRALVAADVPPIPESGVIGLPADLASKVPATRLINTTAPVTGGGDLSADRMLGVSTMTGDAGSGGARGVVPAPAAGDAAAGKFLRADGTWASPPVGGGGGTVTSVGLSVPPEFIAGPPVTTSGSLTLAKATEPANTVWAGPPAAGGGSVVQSASGSSTTGSVSVTFPAPNTAGSLLVAFGAAYGINNPTDTAGNSWVDSGLAPSNGINGRMWYVSSAKAGANTVTFVGGRAAQLHIYEITGQVVSAILDQSASNQGNTSVGTTFSVTTPASVSQAAEVALACFNSNSSPTTHMTAGAGYTQAQSTFDNTSASGNVITTSQIGNATGGLSGTQTATAIGDAASNYWFAMIGTFKLTGSGSSGLPTFRALMPADLPAGSVVPPTRVINTTAPLTGGGNLSADRTLAVSTMTGDAGVGGAPGVVPAPAAGDAAAGKFLKADGTWAVTPAAGGGFSAGGDLSGTSTSQTVIGIQGHAINGGPVDGDLLRYTAATGKWEPDYPGTIHKPLSNVVIAAGDQLAPADLFDLTGLSPSSLCNVQAGGLLSVLGQDTATIYSPAFKGTPTAPTPATGDNSSNIATTAFVMSGYRLIRVFWITASGTQPPGITGTNPYTYTPTAGARAAYVECVGGGGGGGSANITAAGQASAAPGGNGGSYAASWINPTDASYSVTVGALGAAGTAGGAGGAGGDTLFGSVITAKGGGGGFGGTPSATAPPVASNPGAYIAGSVGDITMYGQRGGFAVVHSLTVAYAGNGGGTPFGLGNAAPVPVTPPAVTVSGRTNAQPFGGGGDGAAQLASQATAQAGVAGSPGAIRVWEFA
jgi:hypothetical protein